MNRGEIVVELAQIRALLDGPLCEDGLFAARERLAALEETIRLDDVFDAADCPFEPGRVELVSLQSRPRKTNTKTKKRKAKKKREKSLTKPAAAAPRHLPRRSDEPLTGRIAAMAKSGVSTEDIVALYRIRPEHAQAFVATFVTPAIEAPVEAATVSLTRCPLPS